MRLVALVLMFLVTSAAPASGAPLQRVVSVNITSDEILLAIAPERLVAVSVLADDPEVSGVVREARAVRARVKADTEQILDLRPDLVVIGAHSLHVVAQLEQLGLRVIKIEGFESIAWVERLIRTLGEAVGARARADDLVAAMRSRIDTVRARVSARLRPRVLTYSAGGYTLGRDTLFGDIIETAGGRNVAASLGIVGGKQLGLEQVVGADPDAIVMSESSRWAPGFQAEFLGHPAMRTVRAVRERQIHLLPGRLMITSSHHVAETVETLARRLHPHAFAEVGR